MVSLQISFLSIILMAITTTTTVNCQRSPYAGSRSTGYHDFLLPRQQSNQRTEPQIVSRFGDDNNGPQRPPLRGQKVVEAEPNFAPILDNNRQENRQRIGNRIDLSNSINNRAQPQQRKQQRLPYDAYGDRALVEHYNRLPIDNRPFWLINAEHIERHRNQNLNQVGNFNPIAQRGSFLGSG